MNAKNLRYPFCAIYWRDQAKEQGNRSETEMIRRKVGSTRGFQTGVLLAPVFRGLLQMQLPRAFLEPPCLGLLPICACMAYMASRGPLHCDFSRSPASYCPSMVVPPCPVAPLSGPSSGLTWCHLVAATTHLLPLLLLLLPNGQSAHACRTVNISTVSLT